ncbi:MAG: DUF2851 family protein [Candidatus Latescibacteria bacterium]|nr:DUF2851 family protein [Candidatus Latescibacterota bacterium]
MHRVADGEIAEALVWHLWQHHLPEQRPLKLTDGRQLWVHCTGDFNEDSGPDYKNACLAFGPGKKVIGDVEIHVRSQDWLRHGHEQNSRYNRVALHVVMWHEDGDSPVLKQNGQYLPTLVLSDNLGDCFDRLQRRYERSHEEAVRPRTYPCRSSVERASETELRSLLCALGWKRFTMKAEMMRARMDRVAPEQVLYERLMGAAGYAKNRDAFLDLSQRVPLALVREAVSGLSGKNRILWIQAMLFGTAGLLPSQNENLYEVEQGRQDAYVTELESMWRVLSDNFRVRPKRETEWQFFRLRPFNFPTVRLAGMSYLVSFACDGPLDAGFLHLITSRKPDDDATILLRALGKGLDDLCTTDRSDYWTSHTAMRGRLGRERLHLIGNERRREMIVNVLLPYLYALALNGVSNVPKNLIQSMYEVHPRLSENAVLRNVYSVIFSKQEQARKVIDSAQLQQGVLNIDEQTCYRKDCGRCVLSGGLQIRANGGLSGPD